MLQLFTKITHEVPILTAHSEVILISSRGYFKSCEAIYGNAYLISLSAGSWLLYLIAVVSWPSHPVDEPESTCNSSGYGRSFLRATSFYDRTVGQTHISGSLENVFWIYPARCLFAARRKGSPFRGCTWLRAAALRNGYSFFSADSAMFDEGARLQFGDCLA